jgi:Tol biopolymer transport system component
MAETMTTGFRRTATIAALTVVPILTAGGRLPAQTSAADSTVPVLEPSPQRLAEIDVPIHPTVAPSPDGRMFAAIQTRPAPVLWIVRAGGGEPFAFRQMWATYAPRWSPSGDRIGFIAAIGPPRVWTVELDPATGQPIDPPRLLIRTLANAFAFAPDGAHIALVASRSTAAGASEIHIVNWETRQARVLLRESGAIYRLDWSPDARSIYYGLAPVPPPPDGHQLLKAVSVASGRTSTVRAGGEFIGLSPDGARVLQRPGTADEGSGNLVEVVALEAGSVTKVRLPAGVRSMAWAADSDAIIAVTPAGSQDVIWEIPVTEHRTSIKER